MSFDKESGMPISTPVFWTAVWAGMASPVYVHAPIECYVTYGSPAGIGESFAVVGMQLSEATRVIENERIKPRLVNAS